ncbi:WW domain-containing protein [Aspergillus saccharolyticus JOP 1030-1]|uniref:WW domain-containing protein n=1 Tax=Aspergillus saccharolyticus JOP 1030-1 TaxID=1450539 RepID=A0A318ZGL3_9EURO|nr:hypothetical protein BP01DRAFT_425420 [Aspergillus saccharolyticus JOP 1030-1]PYH42790.1 hypothetical protein BP01DRAFT_425420 [Aspergillus saccharolyticus JOP 1030-1]
MSFAPPPGPPTPSVPEGWKAQFDDHYKQWFFVDLRTGRSQWECPEAPPQAGTEIHGPPSEPPPSYDASGLAKSSASAAAHEKKPLDSMNPYKSPGPGHQTLDDDARLAARLQAEEDARAFRRSPAPGGTASDYYIGGTRRQDAGYQSSDPQSQNSSLGPAQQRSRGFLGKLKDKVAGNGGASYSRPQQPAPQHSYSYSQGEYNYGGGGGYPPQQAAYGYPSYPPQGGYYSAQQQPQQRRHGMGTAGAAALGVGGGLLGGMLLADAVEDMSHDYGPPPGDYGDDYGGDYGGGDDFGDF